MNKFVVSSLSSVLILSLAMACAPSKRAATPLNNKSGANNNHAHNPANPDSAANGGSAAVLTPTQIQNQPAKDTSTLDASKVKNITSYVTSTAAKGTPATDSVVAVVIDTGTATPLTIGAAVDSSSNTLKVTPSTLKGATVNCNTSPAAADYTSKGAAACTEVVFTLSVLTKNSSGTAQPGIIKITNSRATNYKTSSDIVDDSSGVADPAQHNAFSAVANVDGNSLVYADANGNPLADQSNNKKFISLVIDGLSTDTSKTSSVTDSIVLSPNTPSERHYNVKMTGLPKFDSAGLPLTDQNKGEIDDSNPDAPRYIRHMVQTNNGTGKLESVVSTINENVSQVTDTDRANAEAALAAASGSSAQAPAANTPAAKTPPAPNTPPVADTSSTNSSDEMLGVDDAPDSTQAPQADANKPAAPTQGAPTQNAPAATKQTSAPTAPTASTTTAQPTADQLAAASKIAAANAAAISHGAAVQK